MNPVENHIEHIKEMVMVQCDMCTHVYGAHTWNRGCIGFPHLDEMGWPLISRCRCPGFSAFVWDTK